jgi:hypothetical protein
MRNIEIIGLLSAHHYTDIAVSSLGGGIVFNEAARDVWFIWLQPTQFLRQAAPIQYFKPIRIVVISFQYRKADSSCDIPTLL